MFKQKTGITNSPSAPFAVVTWSNGHIKGYSRFHDKKSAEKFADNSKSPWSDCHFEVVNRDRLESIFVEQGI